MQHLSLIPGYDFNAHALDLQLFDETNGRTKAPTNQHELQLCR